MEPSNPYQPPALPTVDGGGRATPIEPGSHLDIHRAIRFFFEDPRWLAKMGVGSLFYVLAFFFIACLVAVVLFGGWGLYYGGFPQFSDVGLI